MEQREIKKKAAGRKIEPSLLRAWKSIGRYVSSITSEREYRVRSVLVDQLLDEIGDNEAHVLSEFLHLVSRSMEEYEEAKVHIPELRPVEVLGYLMQEHKLKQTDLSEIIPQSNLSAVLQGRRELTITQIAKLSVRFGVSADLFIPRIKRGAVSSRAH